MRNRFAHAALVLCGLGVSGALATPALAGDAECSYVEIAATNNKDAKDSTIDPDLKQLEKKLKKPPFTSWNTFKKLSGGTSSLTKNTPVALKLKQATATVMLRDRSVKRVELTVSLDNAAGKRVLDAKPALKVSDWVVLVVSNAKDDGHIVALTCK
jgi:hypothetical protein